MAHKNTPVGEGKSDIVREIPAACADERAAVEFFEKMRWNGEPACPRCGDTDVYAMTNRAGERSARYLWKCRGCTKQFTVRVGTVMEDSPIPLRHWAYAFWAACASKKGVSALQIQRQTGLTYKSALFLMHRIRWAMAENHAEPLAGDVEVDETYVGGKPRQPGRGQRKLLSQNPGRRGYGLHYSRRKAPVVALVQRDGEARARVVADVTAQTLKGAIREEVARSSRILTDERNPYRGIGREYAGGHHTVKHRAGEYGRGDVYTNTVESFFAILKRGITGTYHAVSKQHLHRYVSEFEYRWNTRHLDDGARTARAIRGADGKRLTYREPTGEG